MASRTNGRAHAATAVSREYCLLSENERRQNAARHELILANANAEAAVIKATRDRLIAGGEDPKMTMQFHPQPGETR